MKLIDLSQPLFDGCPNCPVHPPVRSEIVADHPADGWRLEKLSLVNHTGSHIDAPFHKMPHGANLDDIPLESFVGPAHIVDLRGIAAGAPIDAARLSAALPSDIGEQIVLLATGWGDRRAKTDEWLHNSPYLSVEGARWLVQAGVRAVGIDHYSIGGCREPANAETHEVLLGAGLWVVEELFFPPDVYALPGPVNFWCLPINLRGHSGAFCRPVVMLP